MLSITGRKEAERHIIALLKDGGAINPQANRCFPREGSKLQETFVPVEVIWDMIDSGKLVQYEQYKEKVFKVWGLPEVLPEICKDPKNKIIDAKDNVYGHYQVRQDAKGTIFLTCSYMKKPMYLTDANAKQIIKDLQKKLRNKGMER